MSMHEKSAGPKIKELGAPVTITSPNTATVPSQVDQTVQFQSTDLNEPRAFTILVLEFDDDNDRVTNTMTYTATRVPSSNPPTFTGTVQYPAPVTASFPQKCCLQVVTVALDPPEDQNHPENNTPTQVEVAAFKILTVT